jgi:hypothetical protein
MVVGVRNQCVEAHALETRNRSHCEIRWYATVRQAGVSERDCELIRSAFVYEGFSYDLNDPTIATDDPEELRNL